MTTLTLDRARAASNAVELTAAESAIVGIAAAVEARAPRGAALDRASTPSASTASGDAAPPLASSTRTGHPGRSADADPTARPDRPSESPTPVRTRLVPTLAPLPRLTAPTGPGHSRPPTLDERVLARRRAALAAERAAATAEAAVGPVPNGDPTSVCCSLVLAAVESLAGIRAVAQLARWVTPEVYEALSTRAALTVRVLGAGAASRRPEVRRVRVCRIGEHVAEASVVIDDGRRVRAVAVRLESWRGAWRAVALEIG
ncbi:MAG TPA: Rv3235 family protein [Cellulomonas sp.]|uniref:Rv3235 family protein n=1 Tax=Cellulomonas sp. TaxID=40001 RepID=UPI002E37401C|nr:Rv3235 family protein [Cellulomonas sp.]HEX5331586.1 Rv3235 family protein [Cellulomonas sp.]